MNLKLIVWRQKDKDDPGRMSTYEAHDLNHHMSFLEMLDVVNERLVEKGEEPIAFDHDCREGICGMCGAVVNGEAHGPLTGTTLCQLHLRHFKDGDTIYIEPWRARAFPVIKDLIVDRSAFDRIMHAGGYITIRTGSAPESNATLIPKSKADLAMDAAACIGCGACVAACPNASAMLFVGAKISQLALLPQGQAERYARVRQMTQQMALEGFGHCSNHRECEAVCPKEIKLHFIAQLHRDLLVSSVKPAQ